MNNTVQDNIRLCKLYVKFDNDKSIMVMENVGSFIEIIFREYEGKWDESYIQITDFNTKKQLFLLVEKKDNDLIMYARFKEGNFIFITKLKNNTFRLDSKNRSLLIEDKKLKRKAKLSIKFSIFRKETSNGSNKT